jgi:hypothetical protein
LFQLIDYRDPTILSSSAKRAPSAVLDFKKNRDVQCGSIDAGLAT